MLRTKNTKQGIKGRTEVGLGRMLLVSLAVHIVVFIFFSGFLLPRWHKTPRPVYYVDLINLPVKKPQAGRPEAAKVKAKKPEKPKAAPVKKKAPQKAQPKPKPGKKPSIEPKKAVTKPEPKLIEESYEQDTLAKIEELRRKREIEELKKKLAAIAAADKEPSPVPEAPVGMPEGRGNEAGPDQTAWIQAFLKENWSLSKYQVVRQDVEAEVLIVFDAQGNLIDYRFEKKSGDVTFDESVKKAILKAKKLPFQPERRLEINAVFNLKDLME